MNIAIAIGVAGLLIAAAIAFTFRWELAAGPGLSASRLDRWTGRVVFCEGAIGTNKTTCQ